MSSFCQQQETHLFTAFFLLVQTVLIGYTTTESSTKSKPQVDPSPKLAIFGGNLTLLCAYTPSAAEYITKIEWRRSAAKLVFFEQSWDHPDGEPVITWFGAFRSAKQPGASENAAFHGSTYGRSNGVATITIFNVGYAIEGEYTCAFTLGTSDGFKTAEANVVVKLGGTGKREYPEMGRAVSAGRDATRAAYSELYASLSAVFAFVVSHNFINGGRYDGNVPLSARRM